MIALTEHLIFPGVYDKKEGTINFGFHKIPTWFKSGIIKKRGVL